MFERLFEPLITTPGLGLLELVTVSSFLAAILVPRFSPRARAAAITAGISPFWVFLPTVALIAAVFKTPPHGPAPALLTVLQVALLLTQLALGGWVIYRHRRWPWLALPVVLVLLAWTGAALMVWALTGIVG